MPPGGRRRTRSRGLRQRVPGRRGGRWATRRATAAPSAPEAGASAASGPAGRLCRQCRGQRGAKTCAVAHTRSHTVVSSSGQAHTYPERGSRLARPPGADRTQTSPQTDAGGKAWWRRAWHRYNGTAEQGGAANAAAHSLDPPGLALGLAISPSHCSRALVSLILSLEGASRERARSRAHTHTERGERARSHAEKEECFHSAYVRVRHACMYHMYVRVQVCGVHSVTHTSMQHT